MRRRVVAHHISAPSHAALGRTSVIVVELVPRRGRVVVVLSPMLRSIPNSLSSLLSGQRSAGVTCMSVCVVVLYYTKHVK